MKIQAAGPHVRPVYVPGADVLMKCRNPGVVISSKMRELEKN